MAASTVARLRGVLLLVRDLDVAAHFYTTGLGLPVIVRTEDSVVLDGGAPTTLSLQSVEMG